MFHKCSQMWTRRLTWPGEAEDDWLILQDGQIVGRTYLTTHYSPYRQVWAWFKQTNPGMTGEKPTLDEAANKLRELVLADQAAKTSQQ